MPRTIAACLATFREGGREEVLRLESPFQMFFRTTTRPVEIEGVRLDENQKVLVSLGAANRDPEAFSHPDRFDAGRDPNPHVSFGGGIHWCVGAPLAWVELQAAVSVLARRVPALHLDGGEPPRRPGLVFRGPVSLPIRFG